MQFVLYLIPINNHIHQCFISMTRTSNAVAAGATAGVATALFTPGNLGVVCGTFSTAIPVVGQVIAVGAVAACVAAAVTSDQPVDDETTPAAAPTTQASTLDDADPHYNERECLLQRIRYALEYRVEALENGWSTASTDETLAILQRQLACVDNN